MKKLKELPNAEVTVRGQHKDIILVDYTMDEEEKKERYARYLATILAG